MRTIHCWPQENPEKAINIGVAAHISAASPGGPRFEASLSPEARSSASNGIWLCQTCAKLIDNDPVRYTREHLFQWKSDAEGRAVQDLESRSPQNENQVNLFKKMERLMPELLAEMRADLAAHPLCREVVLLQRNWSFWYPKDRELLTYYFDDHPNLRSKIQILENHQLVAEYLQAA
jgi:hypothetical protein